MANITASMVKELRVRTDAGMMDCKNALNECDGDMDAAVDWLRTKGLAKAAKKSSRVAAEGLVATAVDGAKGVIVEINSETDFVARNEIFQGMVGNVASISLSVDGDEAATRAANFTGTERTVDEEITEMVGTIGENMSFRRSAGLVVDGGVVASYIHNAVTGGMGKIAVLVGLKSTGDVAKLEALGKQVAMHVAATAPLAATEAELDQAVIERERQVLINEAKESGKPDNIIEKMVEGRIRKYLEEVVLTKQTFVIDGENTVEKALKLAESDVGAPIELIGFVRFAVGEGIEKEEEDFAAEVAAVAGN